MNPCCVATIVEGHGEEKAVPRLLERIAYEIVGATGLCVLRPIRIRRSKLLRHDPETGSTIPIENELRRAVELAAAKLRSRLGSEATGLVLILLDADNDCPKELVPKVQAILQPMRNRVDCEFILANVEFETWFVGAATSLGSYLRLTLPGDDVRDPEQRRSGKNWIETRFTGARYSETLDQVRLAAKMDLNMCRQRSPSFAKLCKELAARVRP